MTVFYESFDNVSTILSGLSGNTKCNYCQQYWEINFNALNTSFHINHALVSSFEPGYLVPINRQKGPKMHIIFDENMTRQQTVLQ